MSTFVVAASAWAAGCSSAPGRPAQDQLEWPAAAGVIEPSEATSFRLTSTVHGELRLDVAREGGAAWRVILRLRRSATARDARLEIETGQESFRWEDGRITEDTLSPSSKALLRAAALSYIRASARRVAPATSPRTIVDPISGDSPDMTNDPVVPPLVCNGMASDLVTAAVTTTSAAAQCGDQPSATCLRGTTPPVTDGPGQCLLADASSSACQVAGSAGSAAAGIVFFGGCELALGMCAVGTAGICTPVTVAGQPACFIGAAATYAIAEVIRYAQQLFGAVPDCSSNVTTTVVDQTDSTETHTGGGSTQTDTDGTETAGTQPKAPTQVRERDDSLTRPRCKQTEVFKPLTKLIDPYWCHDHLDRHMPAMPVKCTAPFQAPCHGPYQYGYLTREVAAGDGCLVQKDLVVKCSGAMFQSYFNWKPVIPWCPARGQTSCGVQGSQEYGYWKTTINQGAL